LTRLNHVDKPDCSIKLPTATINRSRKFLSNEGLDLSKPFLCLCPGSVNSDAKRWPAEYFAALADILCKRFGFQIVFLGAIQERSLVDSIISQMKTGPAFNFAAKSDIIMSLGIMNLSSLVISNDTGSAHLGVASGAKCLTIFGPTIAGATAPFGERTFIVQGKADCAPCNDHHCKREGHSCMRGLVPQIVAKRASEILTSHP
ncbi:MAG: glycosyltransferase family 9 protein, partial [Desulfomonilaceae bacterium]